MLDLGKPRTAWSNGVALRSFLGTARALCGGRDSCLGHRYACFVGGETRYSEIVITFYVKKEQGKCHVCQSRMCACSDGIDDLGGKKVRRTEMQLEVSNFKSVASSVFCESARKIRDRVDELICDV